MPDPFAIIGLVDTAFGLGCNIYAFFSALKDAPKEIHSFIEELGVFNSVLEEVRKYVKAFTASSLVTEDALTLEIVEITLKQCESEFRDIHDAIKIQEEKLSLSILRKLESSSSWVFDSDERDKSTQRLSRARAALEMALFIINSRQHIIVREEIKFARNDIKEIKEFQQDVLLSLHSMFVAGQERVKSLDSRAEREKTKSQIRLNDLSEKLKSDFASSPPTAATPDRENLSNSSRTAASEADDGIKQDDLPHTNGELPEVISADKASRSSRGAETLQQAFEQFRSQLPPKALEQLQPYLISGQTTKTLDPMASFDQMIRLGNSRHKAYARGPLTAFISATNRMNVVVDMFSNMSPIPTSVLWGSLNLVIQASSKSNNSFENMIEMLEEVNETMRSCEREYKLYPGERIEDLMVKLYTGIFTFLHQSIQLVRTPTLKRLANLQISGAAREDFQTSISKIRQVSASVLKEVEFLHRVELREAHLRLRNMERDQQRMLTAMEDQKKIMSSLKEERKITTMMNDQQTILQAVQSLQMKVSTLNPAFFVVDSNQ